MNAFQLLKSGASFNKGRTEKTEKLFKTQIAEGKPGFVRKNQTIAIKTEDDSILATLDQEIDANKKATSEAQQASDMAKILTLQKEYLTIVNRRKEAL